MFFSGGPVNPGGAAFLSPYRPAKAPYLRRFPGRLERSHKETIKARINDKYTPYKETASARRPCFRVNAARRRVTLYALDDSPTRLK